MNNIRNKRIHFIGIGGSGMSQLAEISIAMQNIVTGSDISNSNLIQKLTRLGAMVSIGHHENNCKDADIIVYSSSISPNNPELVAGYSSTSIEVLHRSTFLSLLMKSKKSITVAGTHGKSTTSALTVFLLNQLGYNPSFAIGATIVGYESQVPWTESSLMVVEADESDGSLLEYTPFIAILTKVDLDHLEFYRDLDHIKETFSQYLNSTNEDGTVITYWDDFDTREVALSTSAPRIAYGKNIGCDIRILSYSSKDGYSYFKAMFAKQMIEVKLPLIGLHNVLNSIAALAVIWHLEGNLAKAASELALFKGVSRRCNLLYSESNLKVYDDYAHNPGKIQACIRGLKESWAGYEIIVVFEPHRYSRLKTLYNELVGSFKDSELVIVLPVFSAGEKVETSMCPISIAESINQASGVKSLPLSNPLQQIKEITSKLPSTPTILLTLGAGKISLLANAIVEYISGNKKA